MKKQIPLTISITAVLLALICVPLTLNASPLPPDNITANQTISNTTIPSRLI